LERAPQYTTQTSEAYLEYDYKKMANFTPPLTRKKPTDTDDVYETNSYNIQDEIKQADDVAKEQRYHYKGKQMTLTCETDIDLGGQKRQDKVLAATCYI
jgi:hypothetical protein